MNQRTAFKIPLGEPTNDQLIEINRRLEILRNKKFKRIDIGSAFVPTSIEHSKFIYDFNIGREQCRYASQFLNDSKRELVFALTDFDKPNGYALPCGEFDAVLLTSGFFVELNKIIGRVFDIFFKGDMSKITGEKNFKNDFFSHFKEDQIKRTNELLYLVRHLSIGHIIGHEFGHLASGHFGFANGEEASEDHNGSLASNLFDIDSMDLLSQAREIEADVYAASWIESLLNQPISSSHTEILIWLKDDACRLSFIFSLSSLLWYVTLGTSRFSTKNLSSLKTHPPASLRAKTILDSALMQNIQRDPKNKNRHESFALEALFLVGLGEAVKRKEDLGDKKDDESQKMLNHLNKISKIDLINKCIGEMGLSAFSDTHNIAIKDYLQEMHKVFSAEQNLNNPLARWKPEKRVKWGI